jgi:large subunit ribosomal protein L21
MYAVVSSGGKQHRFSEGDLIRVERLDGNVGESVVFENVLFIENDDDTLVGGPFVEGAKVSGTIVEHGRGEKIIVFKFKRRKMYRRKRGHRQQFTTVKIDSIEKRASLDKQKEVAEKPKPAAKAKEKDKAETPKKEVKKAARKPSGKRTRATPKKAAAAGKPEQTAKKAPARKAKEAVQKKAGAPKKPEAKARKSSDTPKAGSKSKSKSK